MTPNMQRVRDGVGQAVRILGTLERQGHLDAGAAERAREEAGGWLGWGGEMSLSDVLLPELQPAWDTWEAAGPPVSSVYGTAAGITSHQAECVLARLDILRVRGWLRVLPDEVVEWLIAVWSMMDATCRKLTADRLSEQARRDKAKAGR